MVHDMTSIVRGSCECKTCTFEAKGVPKVRLICHCTICQAFTGKAVSDVMIVPGLKVKMKSDRIAFKKYKKYRLPPPNLNRGRCQQCGKPVVETAGFFPLKILFIPAANFERPDLLPPPDGHLFYEYRQQDAHDDIPKHEGYFDSQRAIVGMIMRAM